MISDTTGILFCKYIMISLCLLSSITLAADNIEELVLANGLKIVVKPDHRSPVAVFQIWYKTGSAYEQEGITGISHMLEHLMFKINKNAVLGKGFNQLSIIGAKGNAYTNRDHTFFYHILEKNHLALAFTVEAERMQHLTPSEDEFTIEKRVILEELQDRINSDPYQPAYDALYKHAFNATGYQFPIIGRSEDLEELTLKKTMSWYNNHYTPENATIVVVGDVDASAVFELSRKYFSSVKKAVKKTKRSRFLTQLTNKHRTRIIMPDATSVGAVLLAYKVPSINTSEPAWESYALEVLAGWFDSGIHSRLTRVLTRDKQLANKVTVLYSPMVQGHSLFIIEAMPAYGISLKHLEQALVDEIKKIKTESISQQILQKVKHQMIATEIYERDSMLTQAEIIGQAESVGIHWSEDANYIRHIKAVTKEQVIEVLQKYFISSREFIVIQNVHHSES